jgi:hypothetical protein
MSAEYCHDTCTDPLRHNGGADCSCPQHSCSRHGDCDACRAKHRNTLPHCERPVER